MRRPALLRAGIRGLQLGGRAGGGGKALRLLSFPTVQIVDHLLSVFVVFAMVVIWYLPPRLLFMVEDAKESTTWVRIALVMAPVDFRWVAG